MWNWMRSIDGGWFGVTVVTNSKFIARRPDCEMKTGATLGKN